MTDAEIRSAVEILKDMKTSICWHKGMDYAMAYDIAISILTKYLELAGVVEEKEITNTHYLVKENLSGIKFEKKDELERMRKDDENFGYNKGRTDTLLAIEKRLEGIEDVISKRLGICKEHILQKDEKVMLTFEVEEKSVKAIANAIRESIRGER